MVKDDKTKQMEAILSKILITSTPQGDSVWYSAFQDASTYGHSFIGVDWAEDSGMSRGDVIKREANVTHVRFKTVVI